MGTCGRCLGHGSGLGRLFWVPNPFHGAGFHTKRKVIFLRAGEEAKEVSRMQDTNPNAFTFPTGMKVG